MGTLRGEEKTDKSLVFDCFPESADGVSRPDLLRSGPPPLSFTVQFHIVRPGNADAHATTTRNGYLYFLVSQLVSFAAARRPAKRVREARNQYGYNPIAVMFRRRDVRRPRTSRRVRYRRDAPAHLRGVRFSDPLRNLA